MNYYLKVLQNYATFSGRARRSEYWYFVQFNVIISVVFGFVCGLMQVPQLANIYTLAVLIPSIAVGVRRMHDVGKSGWFLLIPIYNLIKTNFCLKLLDERLFRQVTNLYKQKNQLEQLQQFIIGAMNFLAQGQQPTPYGIFIT